MKSYNVNQQLITDTIKPLKEKDEICAAEAALVFHGVKHRHSHLAQQCLTSVRKTIFSSSTVANHLSCGRTKSTSIALNVLAPYITRCLLDDLRQSFYYSLHFDASNKGNTKVYSFCVKFLSSSGVKKGMFSYFIISRSFLIFLGIFILSMVYRRSCSLVRHEFNCYLHRS
jgi:hypothetical protein